MLKSKKFWAYEPCQAFELKQETIDNYKIKGKFYEDVIFFYDQIGVAPHPGLKAPIGKEPGEMTSLSFINNMLDINTIKILLHMLPYTKIIALKFCSNSFDIDNLAHLINNLISTKNNVFFLMYEWNNHLMVNGASWSLQESMSNSATEEVIAAFKKQSELMVKMFNSTKFEGICLRGNYIGDATAIEIFTMLTMNNNTLKVLSLYQNDLTSKCLEALCSMLEKNKKLEEINLGKNYFKDEDIAIMNKSMGKYPMTMEDVDNYNKKAKERDLIIAKNTKLRITKKPELEVPYLDEMTQIEDKFFIIKNNRLKLLNFMANPLTDKSFESFKYMLDYNDDLLLTLDENIFTQEHKDIFTDKTGKYYSKFYFSKC